MKPVLFSVFSLIFFAFSFTVMTPEGGQAAESSLDSADRPLIVILPGAQAELAVKTEGSDESLIELGEAHAVAVEFLAGMPAGFRLKVMAGGGWVIEASIAGALTSVGSGEVIGLGARKEFVVTSDGVNNGFIIAPGADIYFMPGDPNDSSWFFRQPSSNVYFLAANADLMWLHDFAPNFGIELGARLGAAIALDGKDSRGAPAAGTWMPDLGFILGIRI